MGQVIIKRQQHHFRTAAILDPPSLMSRGKRSQIALTLNYGNGGEKMLS